MTRQRAATWNTVWSHVKPCLQAASDRPVRRRAGDGELMSTYGTTRTDADEGP